jgi:TM2 domain-containing membrane protein YozV
MSRSTHSLAVGYILWIFGFLGAHRFYYGKPVSGTIYFFTLGLFFIGWIIDLFLMPKLEAEADSVFTPGDINYTIAWVLLTFLGIFGIHRFYMGKWGTGLIYLFTCGFFLIGVIYDYWTLNDQISQENTRDYDYAY